ncbi:MULTISPECIES: hypothetical protein [Paenibacillus]|uniref:hypothetical protein n=1 Tax=Paenibacillus TaxID=44249 RepID=UPI00096D7064|nr:MULTISPECIES: hypothetical protein [Paenibacillus]MDH6430247.1 hypothetical protein [Paenibacillus sp. PastH-4]MDH6446462.1 hypothetical protein [Paenibacillus sp. PastF-4]MDH6530072.1 hypothetical protein [Paenibacillus sp. PastH-3]OMD10038.1 hypothetical protein BJP50_29010 [Paenibacillus odorifer]
MIVSIQAELAAAKLHLDRAIEASIQASDARHLSKLGAARYEIVETLIRMNKEADINAATSCVS